MEQAGGRGRRQRPRGPREEQQPAFSRAARAPESRRGRQRRPPLTLEGKPEEARAEGGGERHGRFGDRDRRDGERRGGPRESRTYTIESEKQVAETRTHKGELTSLAGLRALLQRAEPQAQKAEDPPPEAQPS
jgi:hypothetical protein